MGYIYEKNNKKNKKKTEKNEEDLKKKKTRGKKLMQKGGAFLILLQCACVWYKRYMPIWNILVNLTLIFHVFVIYIVIE